ncbi:hypothetical protein [Prevotella sp. KH2C16]|uniref:hypothetical protein n=1 Tax=Prevotella sp. KH2C16 TaxID=1855325 RepID=UPI0008E36829|nr:hypothetical protein [Prevotella sp. KH2C16]SFG38201.1 hypothetical protein SAMN05216383_11211 [Prevotella sp. KH2C16]SFG75521.1 hypothetical protein SAMN05216383_13911 [Prevotella sp. KH2C16]
MRTINSANYFLATKVTFAVVHECCTMSHEDLDEVWHDLMSRGFEHTVSPKGSGSEYLVDEKNGIVYRKADHWGRCASCNWKLGAVNQGAYAIAKASFADFEDIMTPGMAYMLKKQNLYK